MTRLNSLIARGAEIHGSLAALAAHLGIHQNSLSGYKAGTRPCGLEMHVRIAIAARLTDTEVRDYAWEVLKERMGKTLDLGRTVAMLFIACITAGFVQPAEAAGPEWTPKSDNV